jgi:hypothetical protein
MTDERDPKLQSAYRALGAEEPPRALDDAILARARRPARSWTQRWAVPLSLAAVVVLSVTVTLRIQHEQPGIEMPAPAKKEVEKADQPAPAAPLAEAPARPAADPAVRVQQPKTSARRDAEAFPSSSQDRAPAENRAKETAPAAAPLAETQVEAPALAKRADARSELGSATGSLAAPQAPPAAAPAMRAMRRDRVASERMAEERPALTPEQELERIAGLRKEQKHDEADKALAEFRKRYPEFKIPAPMLERVERR